MRITSLDEHPNAAEINAILGRVDRLEAGELCSLARAWAKDPAIAAARSKSLQPDSPLILDVLCAFEMVSEVYAEALAGRTQDAPVTTLALKAVRDAIAAAYARPSLSREDHRRLIAPWRSVFPALVSS